jgi:hypothetical protein
VWVLEGLAEFYGNTRIEGRTVFVGAPSSWNVSILRRTPLLPVTTLFDINKSSPYYNEQNKISILYAESWALTHYSSCGTGVSTPTAYRTSSTCSRPARYKERQRVEPSEIRIKTGCETIVLTGTKPRDRPLAHSHQAADTSVAFRALKTSAKSTSA